MANISHINTDKTINSASLQSGKPAAFDEKPIEQSKDETIATKTNATSASAATERASEVDGKKNPSSPFAGRTFGTSNSKTFLKQDTGNAVAEHKAKEQE